MQTVEHIPEQRQIPAPIGEPESAYVHIPFCAHKCGYCDFASVAGQDDRREEYLTALDAEMASLLQHPRSVRTIFVGGGTPTYLSHHQLERLLLRLRYWFPQDSLMEFTVEANPETVDAQKIDILADHGVTRISLGAQSFQPQHLVTLERQHSPGYVDRAVEIVRKRIDNFSLDLIFGVPGQTLEQWQSDLERLLQLGPKHCSTYGLTYEKGTPLWRQRSEGVIRPIDEELELAMYEHSMDRLRDAGFEQYEISNFAKLADFGADGANYRCQHNLTYWANDPCFGFGTGAAAYVGGTRTLNTRELNAYIQRCISGIPPVSQSETLEPVDRAKETAIVNLRRLDGIVKEQFLRQTGFAIEDLIGDVVRRFVQYGLLEDDGKIIRFTRRGLTLSDSVFGAIL